MKKTLKKSELIILIFLVVAAVIFIAVKSRSGLLLLNPSKAKDAFGYVQKLDFYTQETVNNNGEKGMQGTGFFHYIDSDGSLDYYTRVDYENSSENISIVKTKNEKIIKNYPLTSSQLQTDRTPYVSNGVYKNGYLYFIVQGVNAIYRIDGNLEKCAVYLDGSNYGGVGASSLCFHNDKIMYVTSDGCVVAYDGKAESVFCKIPPMNETKGYGYDFFNNRYKTGEESNYLICSDGENVFCSEGTNIYLCTADGLESLNFDVALLEDSGRSFISKIEFADDGDLMYVTLVYCGSETSKQIRLYVYDVDNGKQACFKQKTKARFRDCPATQTDS